MSLAIEPLVGDQKKIFDYILSITVSIGVVSNLTILSSLLVKAFPSKFTTVMLRNQAFIDLFVCLFTLILIIFPNPLNSGVYLVDHAFCLLWTAQSFFWWFVLAGVFNLIFTGLDRYSAVVHPNSYKNNLGKKIAVSYFFIVFVSFVISGSGTYLQTSYQNRSCISQSAITGAEILIFFKAQSIIWFLSVYGAPSVILVIIYWYVITTVARSSKTANVKSTSAASTSLTKATIMITLIFLCTIAYDAIYYLLGYWHVAVYNYNSPLQLIGVFFTSLNSSLGGIVLFVMVKSVRIRIYNMLGFVLRKNVVNPTSQM